MLYEHLVEERVGKVAMNFHHVPAQTRQPLRSVTVRVSETWHSQGALHTSHTLVERSSLYSSSPTPSPSKSDFQMRLMHSTGSTCSSYTLMVGKVSFSL